MTGAVKIMSAKGNENKEGGDIKISGDITIVNIKKIHQEINSRLKDNNRLIVIVERISTFDLTFVQLLFALKSKKSLSLNINISKEQESDLKRLGFHNLL